MKPAPKVFSKESPCTKWEIWHCFRAATGFVAVPVVEAQAQIGVNVPRVMEREGRISVVESKGVEYYELTPEGEEWLLRGFRAYLKNHPAMAHKARHLPTDWVGAKRTVRRVRR